MRDLLDSDLFDAAAAQCRQLSRAEARHFVEKGYVVVKGAFSKDIAALVRERTWAQLAEQHGVNRGDPASWARSFHGPRGLRGYVRTGGNDLRFALRTDAPQAFAAQLDVLGGPERLPPDAELSWGSGAIANLGAPDHAEWQPPQPRQPGWHKDGWHFRHFLNSPEQGLLTVPIYSDIQPRSGGTFIATDSIAPVTRLLAAHPEGFHADSVQGAGYLIPYLIEQCSSFEELTGEAGDMAILHPYMLHRAAPNPSDRPRFIANVAVVLNEPMRFNRPCGPSVPPAQRYSLVELAVLRALQVDRFDFEQTNAKEPFVPGPFRDEEEAKTQRRRLQEEMRATALTGLATPAWAAECGYMSNQTAAL